MSAFLVLLATLVAVGDAPVRCPSCPVWLTRRRNDLRPPGTADLLLHARSGPDQASCWSARIPGGRVTAWDPTRTRCGREIKPKIQMTTDAWWSRALPERVYEGGGRLAKNQAGYSEPVILNSPELWWCHAEVR